MDDEIDPVLVRVQADADAFRRDVGALRDELAKQLVSGADVAGRGITGALSRAARSGKLEFEDLARMAGKALGDIAAAALRMDAGGAAGGGGLGGLLTNAVGSLLGLPGRATGGPVSPGQAFLVGERGPELFVPTAAGRVETLGGGQGPVSVTVNVSVPAGNSAEHLARSGQQVARAVARALDRSRGVQ